MFMNKDRNRTATALRLFGRLIAVGTLLVGATSTAPALAEVTRVVTAEFAPLTDNSSPGKKGLITDLVVEMMKLQKISKPVEFMSWNDAVKVVESEKGAITFPMTRTTAREAKYKWLCKIFDMERSFAVKPGGTAVNTIDEAKALKAVGTTSPSASLNFLKAQGLTNIVEFPSSRDLLKGLLDGKVDAVYQPDPFTRSDWRAVTGQGALVFGKPQEESAAYLAANKDSDINPADWQDALQVLEQDGTFQEKLKLYGMEK